MTEILRPDFCVIGGGPGGLAAARAAAHLGAQVVLVDKRGPGGNDPLYSAWQAQLLAAAAARRAILSADMPINGAPIEAPIDFQRLRRAAEVAAERFAREDSPLQLAGLGVRVIPASGSFVSRARFEAGDIAIEARKFLLAIGAFMTAPAIAGLEVVRPLTADAIAELTSVPNRLAVIGGTPENLMLAQAFLRLGSAVVLLLSHGFLNGEDPELTMPLLTALRRSGLEVIEQADVRAVELIGPAMQGLKLVLGDGTSVEASHLLYAGDRMPLVEGLGLKAARVSYGKEGIKRKRDGRSSNRKIYAISDGFDSFQNIRAARREGEWVAEQIFGQKLPPAAVARVIPTDPEVASIGLSEAQARAQVRQIRLLRAAFCDNLRAQTGVQPPAPYGGGHIKIITDAAGRLLGAGIVGPNARELMGLLSLALAKRLTFKDFLAVAASEPALMDICRAAALASVPQTGKVRLRRMFAALLRPMR